KSDVPLVPRRVDRLTAASFDWEIDSGAPAEESLATRSSTTPPGLFAPVRPEHLDRYLPADLPPVPLAKHYFTTWTRNGVLNHVRNSLRDLVRGQESRNAPRPPH